MVRKLIPFTLLLVIACGRLKEPTAPGLGGGDPIDPTATFTRVQNEIFTPTFAQLGFHVPLVRQESLILSPGRSSAHSVGCSDSGAPGPSPLGPEEGADA